MSRSQPTAKNPAQRFMQWAGGQGNINYWDKANEESVEVKLPFTFLVLDEFTTITGFSEKDHSGFWSNEVKDLNDDLTVKTKSGTKLRGKYADISAELKGLGGKYAKSVYIAFFNEEKELVIGNFKFSGAALTAWIELNKKFDVYNCAVVITGTKAEKKGATKYFVPVFETKEVSATTEAESKKLDQQLQHYIQTYMSQKSSDEPIEANDFKEDVEIEDLTGKVEITPPKETTKEKPIDLADVPF